MHGLYETATEEAKEGTWDSDVKGLHVRVSQNGEKVFAVWYRVYQQPHRLNIGRWPVMTLKDARVHALKVLADAGKGIDDVSTRRATTAAAQQRRFRDDRFEHLAEAMSESEALTRTRPPHTLRRGHSLGGARCFRRREKSRSWPSSVWSH